MPIDFEEEVAAAPAGIDFQEEEAAPEAIKPPPFESPLAITTGGPIFKSQVDAARYGTIGPIEPTKLSEITGLQPSTLESLRRSPVGTALLGGEETLTGYRDPSLFEAAGPAMMALGGGGRAMPVAFNALNEAVTGAFVGNFIAKSPDAFSSFTDAMKRGDTEEAKKIAIDYGFGAAFTGLMAKGLHDSLLEQSVRQAKTRGIDLGAVEVAPEEAPKPTAGELIEPEVLPPEPEKPTPALPAPRPPTAPAAPAGAVVVPPVTPPVTPVTPIVAPPIVLRGALPETTRAPEPETETKSETDQGKKVSDSYFQNWLNALPSDMRTAYEAMGESEKAAVRQRVANSTVNEFGLPTPDVQHMTPVERTIAFGEDWKSESDGQGREEPWELSEAERKAKHEEMLDILDNKIKGDKRSAQDWLDAEQYGSRKNAKTINDSYKEKWQKQADEANARWEQWKQQGIGKTSSEDLVKAAIKDARENGASPEFRAFFGGLDPAVAGTTPEKVAAFAKSLGMEWRPVQGVTPTTPEPVDFTPEPTAPTTHSPADIAKELGLTHRGTMIRPNGEAIDQYVDENGVTVSVPGGSSIDTVRNRWNERKSQYEPDDLTRKVGSKEPTPHPMAGKTVDELIAASPEEFLKWQKGGDDAYKIAWGKAKQSLGANLSPEDVTKLQAHLDEFNKGLAPRLSAIEKLKDAAQAEPDPVKQKPLMDEWLTAMNKFQQDQIKGNTIQDILHFAPKTAAPPAAPPTPEQQAENVKRFGEAMSPQASEELVNDLRKDGWNVSGVSTSDKLFAYFDIYYRGHKISESDSAAEGWKKIMDGEVTPGPANEIRDLIDQDVSGIQKAANVKKLADQNGITVKEMQEQIESEIVKMGHEVALTGTTGEDQFDKAVKLYYQQPTMSGRTSTSVGDQAYSTPLPLSVALNHALDLKPTTPIYDPTGGNGMLLMGGHLAKSHGNEINPGRAAAMRKLGVGTVTEHDATKFVPSQKFPVVKTNPPFGGIPNVNYQGFSIKKLEHLISLKALEAMAPDGKAAIILGAKMQPGESTAHGAQWVFENYLYGHYNVVGNFELSGDLYAKQGAAWPVRVLVVDGKREPPVGGVLSPEKVDRLDTWDDVWKESDRIRNEIARRRQALGAPRPPGVPVRAPGTTTPSVQPPTVSLPPRVAPGPSVGPSQPAGARPSQPPASQQPPTGGTRPTPVGPVPKPSNQPPTTGKPGAPQQPVPPVEAGLPGRAPAPANAPEGGAAGGGTVGPRIVPQPPVVAGTEHQNPYVPRSKGNPFGTLSPKGVVSGTEAALDALQKRVGPIDDFVANRLNMTPDEVRSVMAAEQIDGVALAIDQMETGGAVIIGDETGIGKGRQGAAVIRYAKLNGKIPMFFTQDPKLFSDMYGDLQDINTTITPLIFGDPVKATIVDAEGNVIHRSPGGAKQKAEMVRIEDVGFADSGYDAIFVTYSQVNKRNQRQQFLEGLARNQDTIVILDEAHNSAGDANTSMQAAFMSGGVVVKGSGPDRTQTPVPGLLNQAGTKQGRGGVLYMSATYAKRPDNMPVYFRTSLSKAADSFGQIVEAMKRGGVALQQAVSESLAKVGQYIRRERDFTGVTYTMKRVKPDNEEALKDQVDQVTDVLSEIVRFSGALRDAVVGDESSTSQSEDAISMTDFASIVHNQVGQLLLAAKADAIVQEAIDAKKAGEKPVIAIMNTMESFLDHFVDDKGIKQGQPIQLRWNELLLHALERSLRTTRDNPDGSTTIGQADPYAHGLGPLYESIRDAAQSIESNFPVSPIDYIIQKLKAAGVTMLELTGRESGINYTNPDTGQGTYARFKKANKNTIVNQFNSGQADGMLLNASGSTGLSAHASEKFKDQRPRHMIIGQPALDINVFVQTLGRIKRTGMVKLGKGPFGPYGAKYTHLVLPLQAEIRPAAIAAKKMKSLNANTTAETDAAVKIQSEDIMNKYGDQIVAEFLDEHPEIQAATGIWIGKKEGGALDVPADVSRKFTGRMAIRPDAEQAQIYQQIIPAYNELIQQLKATGDYDLEVAVHDDWDAKLLESQDLVPGTDEGNIFTAGVRVQKWEIKDPRHVPTGQEMQDDFERRSGTVQKVKDRWHEWQQYADRVLDDALTRTNELQPATPFEETVKANQIDRINEKRDQWDHTRGEIQNLLRQVGEVVELTNSNTGESYPAVLVEVKLPKMGAAEGKGAFGGLRIGHSAFRFRYAIDSPGGVLYLHAGHFLPGDSGGWNIENTSLDFSDLTGKKPDARYERTFVVGNPIRGYDATGGVGKVARFKTSEGEVVTGLMMPRNWDMGKLAKDPRLDLVSGAAASWFLREHGGGRTSAQLEAAGGVVRVGQSWQGPDSYIVTTPSAKRTGGVIYLDRDLLKLTGDFTKVGNRMQADVNVSDLPKVIEQLMKIVKGRLRPVGRIDDVIAKVAEANRRAKSSGPEGNLYSGIPIPGIIHAFEYTFRDLGEKIPGWAGQIRNGWRSFTVQAMPRTTASNRLAGEAGARSAVAPGVGRTKGLIFASKVTEGITVPDFDLKFGTGLNEDNLRDIKRQFEDKADEAENRDEIMDDLRGEIADQQEMADEGDRAARKAIRAAQKEIARLSALTDEDVVKFRDKANAVVTTIGAEGSPFETEQEYRDFMDSEEAQSAIDRHIALWESEKDPIYRQSIDLDPEAPLTTRGLDYGARVNLKNVLPDEVTKTTIRSGGKGKFVKATATLKKSNPHKLQAKGTGNYEGSYQEIMASGFEYEYTVAKQHEYIRKLLTAGDARVTPKKYMPTLQLKGEQTVGYPLRFTPWRNQYLQIRKSLATEYEDATGIAPLPRLALYTTFGEIMTKLSVQGLAEGSTHAANMLMKVFTGLGPTGNPFLNALLKSVGRADLLVSLPKVVIKAFGDRREEMLKLAEIGAGKEPYKGMVGWALTKLDQGVRLYSAGVYRDLARAGYVPNTETGLREFVTQVGQYNKALQPRWLQFLRSTHLQPFATAMQTFNVQGLRTMVTSPGVKAANKSAALALRADLIGGIIGFVVLLKLLQLLLTKDATPPPGTKLGAVGWIGDDGKLHQFDLGALTGYTRGLRWTGLQGYIEAKRLGLDTGTALTAGGSALFNTGLSTLTGPMNRFITVGATGYRPSVPPVREAPAKLPQDDEEMNLLKTQFAQNIMTAVQESSPILDFGVRGPLQGDWWEALTRQFSRYTPKTGMSTETIEKLPEIVQAGQLHTYTDALAKEARKHERGTDRNEFIQQKLDAEGADGPMRKKIMDELKRKGTFKYE